MTSIFSIHESAIALAAPEAGISEPGVAEQLEFSLRHEIAQSWHRSKLGGLSPGHTLDRVDIEEVDRHSRLLDAASPVLDRLARDLSGTGFCVLLADRDARLIDMRFGQPGIEHKMEGDGALRGRRFLEYNTGTNSIATVFETRAPLAVRGEEHFVESLKKFTCYGVPIIHPVTRRLDGVLDLTALSEQDSPLLGAFIGHAAAEMEARLLERSHVSEHDLLRAFQLSVARRTQTAVVGLSTGVFLENPVAERLLDQVDVAVIRAAVEEAGHDTRLRLTLRSGVVVDAQINLVARLTAVVVLTPVDQPAVSVLFPRDSPTTGATATTIAPELVLVRGEPGTGRTHTAMTVHLGARRIRCDALAELSTSSWLRSVAEAVQNPDTAVVIDDIELLTVATAHRLGELLDARRASVVLTQSNRAGEGSSDALTVRATRVRELPTIRSRPDLIAPLAAAILRTIAPDRGFTSEALSELTRRSWPGNIAQLARTVDAAAADARFGDITTAHLPAVSEIHRGDLNPLRRAERDTITGVLDANGHNKSRAADQLRISRTTLYKRMKQLGIPG